MENLIIMFSGILVYCLIVIIFGSNAYQVDLIKERLIKVETKSLINDEVFEDIPFLERVVKPSIDSIIQLLTKVVPVRKKEQEQLGVQLLQAGIRINPINYSVMRTLIIFLFAIVSSLYATNKYGSKPLYIIGGATFGLYMGYAIMRFSLTSRISHRQENISKQFPEFLDLLSVCVEAGLGFDQAVSHVSKQYSGEISDEFKIMLREITLGSTRKKALLSLQTRVPLEQLKTFSAAVIQADETGISLKNILNVQASNVRLRYKQKIEEKAQKLSIKIMFPMIVFIFPVIFIIIMGPSIPSLMQMFGS